MCFSFIIHDSIKLLVFNGALLSGVEFNDKKSGSLKSKHVGFKNGKR